MDDLTLGGRRTRQMPRKTAVTTTPKPEDSILVRRLRHMIALRNTTAQAISKAAGFNPGMLRDVFAGKVKRPAQERLELVAKILMTDVGYLLGQHDDESVKTNDLAQAPAPTPLALPRRIGVRPVRIVGIAEAGSFRTDPIDWKSDTMIDAITNRLMPDARHFVLLLRSRSLRETGDTAGYALCTDAPDLPVSDGKHYVVLHSVGSQVEVTVRRATVLADRVELRDFMDGRNVLAAGRDLGSDPSEPISVMGVAYAVLRPLG
jgi:transcriptional regulator with XRE-family HTH domain